MTPQQEAEARARAQAEAQARALAAQQSAPSGPMISAGGQQLSVADYQALPEAERQALRDQVGQSGTHAGTQSSPLDPFVQGTTFGWADEGRGLVQGALAAAQGGDFGSTYRRTVDESRGALAQQRRVDPVGSFVAEAAGAIPTAAAAGGQLVGRGASLLSRGLTGAAVGSAQGAVYGAGASEEGQRVDGAAVGAAVGGGVGMAAPYAGNLVQNRMRNAAQGRILNQAARNAPQASELRTAASALFDQADSANIMIQRPAFQRLYQNVERATQRFRPNVNLDPRSTGALQVLQQTVDDVMAPGSNVVPDLRDIHMLRQAAQKAAVSSQGRDAAIANTIVRQIDDFVEGLTPADVGGGVDPSQATRALREAISTWSRASKVGILEDAVERAGNAASGLENGLRVEFRKILNNRKLRTQFTGPELQAIRDVVKGSPAANLTKLLGKFGFGSGNASNMMGGTVGGLLGGSVVAGGNPLGGIALAATGTASRRASEALTSRAANRAIGAAATPNLQALPMPDQAVPGLLERTLRGLSVPAAGQIVGR